MNKMLENIMKRTEWFRKDRFGMFLHWGLYSIPAKDPWVKSLEKMTDEEYQRYFDEFNPYLYNPREWAKMAKAAGMKYAVLTTKHHDGFCLFDSQYTDYKSTNTPCGKDLIKEYTDAFREEGIKVGLYYSLLDWHHPDYPSYGDETHPMRNDARVRNQAHNFDNYLDYMHNQVRELCTNYGKIDIMWFDFSYGDMIGEVWRAEELVKMVRSYFPDIIIDNRLETSGKGMGSIVTEEPKSYSGDFVSPEMMIPPNGICNYAGEPVPWETCTTLNNNWGYCISDKEFKSIKTIIRKLVECVSKGGNMILGVGPQPKGTIDKKSTSMLRDIGEWMENNSESIYGCGISEFPKPEWGRYTQKGNTVYAHILEQPIGPIPLTGIPKERIKSIKYLADKTEIRRVDTWIVDSYKEICFVTLGEVPHFTYELYDDLDTVLEIELID